MRRPIGNAAGRAVRVDDALAEQVVDGLTGTRLVGAEEVVEGVVLADDDDDVLDRRRRRPGECWRDAQRAERAGGEA